MSTPRHYYAYASIDTVHGTGVHTNYAWTMKEVREDLAFFRKHGCPVGPVVKVLVPKVRARARGAVDETKEIQP